MLTPLDSWSSVGTWATFPNGNYRGNIGGVQIQKCADDLDRYKELIDISQPDLVVETGSRDGGSALWFREQGLQVVSVDLTKPDMKNLPGYDRFTTYPGIEFVEGSSISDWVFEVLLKRARGKRVMVSLDSDHHSPHVQAEIGRLGALVSKGCYLVVEDACFEIWAREGKPDQARVGGHKIPELKGPLDAIEKGLENSSQFWRDTELEGLTPISHSPCGWWRRHD